MSEKPTRRLGEFFHGSEDMDDPVAEERSMAATRERARRRGASEELIEQMYGKPRSKEEIIRALEERRERARRSGWTEENIEKMYGWTEENIEKMYGWTEEEIEQMYGKPHLTQAK